MANTDEFTGSRFMAFYYGAPEASNVFFREGFTSTKLAMPGTEEEIIVLIPQQRIFEATLTRVTSGVLFMEAGMIGTIRNVYLHSPSSSPFGSWIFNVRHNGVALWSGGNRLVMTGPTPSVEKTGLNIPVAKGDSLILDLEQKGSGSMFPPLIWIVTIETQ